MTLSPSPHEWNLRTEILDISHRWLQVFLAFLLGSLLGWGAAFLFPTPYRAQNELYVAYNGDAIYRNSDDFKNWQFGELDAYIVSNDVLGETLNRLRQQDPYWLNIAPKDLKPQLRTYWRNAGRWRLVVEWSGRARTEQLSRTWTDVILEKTRQAAIHAQAVLLLGGQIEAHSRDEVVLRLQTTQLAQVRTAIQAWRDAHSAQPGVPPDTLNRWRIQFLASSVASLLPGELALLAQFPPPEAALQDYLPAVDQGLVALDEQLSVVQRQAADLGAEHEALAVQWEAESKAAHNLTANLQVEPLAVENEAAQPVRPTSQMALVGGLLGVLVWGLVWLARPLRKAGK